MTMEFEYREEYIKSSRGVQLFTCRWLPANSCSPKALVFLCHGYGMECSGFMRECGVRLASARYAVFGIDYEGHGRSTGSRCYIKKFENIVNDCDEFFKSVCAEKEYRYKGRFLYGESMGGAVALLLHKKEPSFYNGAVLAAPMCKISEKMKPHQVVINILTGFEDLIPKWKIVPSKDVIDSAFKDPVKREEIRNNKLIYQDKPRLKTALEMLRTSMRVEESLNKVTLPFLVLHGDSDTVTDPEISKALYERASSTDKTMKLYPGMWHGLTKEANSPINPKSGFNSSAKTFHNLRPPIHLPPEETPFSAAEYALSLHANHSPWPDSLAIINSSTSQKLSYSDFIERIKSLTMYLQTVTRLRKNDTAFILCPNSIKVPILYFSLLSLGVVISPANPISTESEISHQISLSNPVIAFAISKTCHKLPKLKHGTILIDSPEFDSIITMSPAATTARQDLEKVTVNQSDLAAIMYSSGTTGKVKGVMLTHRNLMAVIAGYYPFKQERKSPTVMLYTVPYFHVFGFFYSFKSVALSETVVVMERFDLKKMLRAVEKFRVTHLAVAPPVVVAMAKSDLTDGYDLRSLETVGCGGAPLGKDVMKVFTDRFPTVDLWQGYGLTESTGVLSRSNSPEESRRWGSVGRLTACCEAKIVDADTGDALPPGKQGELWVRGSTIMKGYVGDPEANSTTMDPDGWLRTGDLCYIDGEGFLFVVDRLKELIKYKGYQVAPAELEQLLQSHPEIADAAVIPYPDEEAGQVPMAFVVKQPQSRINERGVMDFVAKQVAPYKKVRRVEFVSAIPKSPAGKILRKELRKMVLVPFPSSKM